MASRLFAFARRLDKGLFPWMGPAQLGAGHAEEPYRAPVDPSCPVCGGPLREHTVARNADQSHATRLLCPPRTA